MTAVLWVLLLLAALGGAGVAWGIRDTRDTRDTRRWVLPSLRVLRLNGNRRIASHETAEQHNRERGK